MLTRRQWLQASAGALALGVQPGAAWAQDDRSVIAARFGSLPARPGRVFASGPPAGVLLAALAPQQLLGWPMELGDAARAHLGSPLQALPYLGRLSGRGSTLPLEKLLALQPDLVLDSGTSDATHVSATERLARQTGLACVLVQGSLSDHARQLREVGSLLGASERGETLAGHADEVARLVRAVTAGLGEQARPRVYLGRGANGLETGLAGSINVEVIEYAGGRNVAAQAGRGGLTRVSMEQILVWDPEVILTQEAGFAERVRQDPLWRGISAVRSGRVHCAPVLPFGWLDGPPSVNRLIGVRWLLEKLHPGRPPRHGATPLEQAVRKFYALFYGVQLSPAQLQALLQAAR
ncbi:iron ABC transporter substrate-binding protein [Comamonas thiooxydans]|uniref:Iron ABC transporter substrate-binding protein n=1 Tax=Comamonas thiooxydans TaxID=363952 RepID=A0AA42Q2I9_9BURK|nr:iron ABC transporter substrate-binding protein [Comamonas thiooxydans]MDH1335009.1 iron ABC transporter substrate-binding protein [Comamonas thiooxydans]MDH1741160.1 iron ABC transporter substrate-binding protein [Comamonas thiooxydans]MDH1787444.1 iron ABC transporter substrate-binding protein [Comamonas thiooxydans]